MSCISSTLVYNASPIGSYSFLGSQRFAKVLAKPFTFLIIQYTIGSYPFWHPNILQTVGENVHFLIWYLYAVGTTLKNHISWSTASNKGIAITGIALNTYWYFSIVVGWLSGKRDVQKNCLFPIFVLYWDNRVENDKTEFIGDGQQWV